MNNHHLLANVLVPLYHKAEIYHLTGPYPNARLSHHIRTCISTSTMEVVQFAHVIMPNVDHVKGATYQPVYHPIDVGKGPARAKRTRMDLVGMEPDYIDPNAPKLTKQQLADIKKILDPLTTPAAIAKVKMALLRDIYPKLNPGAQIPPTIKKNKLVPFLRDRLATYIAAHPDKGEDEEDEEEDNGDAGDEDDNEDADNEDAGDGGDGDAGDSGEEGAGAEDADVGDEDESDQEDPAGEMTDEDEEDEE